MNERSEYYRTGNDYTQRTDERVGTTEREGINIGQNASTYTLPQEERSEMVQNAANLQNNNPNTPEGGITTPPQSDFDNPAFQGSMQQILSENLGEFVVIEFLIGTQEMTEKMGILYSVGRGFVVLYEELQNRYVVCDIFSIKFVTFYEPGQRPQGYNGRQNTNGRTNGRRMM